MPTNQVMPELEAHRAEVADLELARMVRRAATVTPPPGKASSSKYGRLIWSITRDFKLVESDAADVFQTTWMRLIEHINRIDHPDRVGSWLATTARNECLRCLAARKRLVVAHEDVIFDDLVEHGADIDEGLLAQERAEGVRAAMEILPWRWRRLMELLMSDPPVSYAEISDELGLPIGSIGPTRARCLARLRTLLEAS